MTKITRQEIEHIAILAKLKLTEDEIEKFGIQLSEVVNFISQLKEVDTKKVEPTSQTTGLENVFRIDRTSNTQSLTQEEATLNAKKVYNNYFVVPALINKNKK